MRSLYRYASWAAGVLVLTLSMAFATAANAATYSQTQTLPVPPASSFSGTAGGDGWDLSVGTDRVYNVFHHDAELRLACLEQVDASTCWGGAKTIVDPISGGFQTGNRSGTFLNEADQKIYAYVYRGATAGVACVDIDPSQDGNPNPFCGFTALDSSTTAEPSAPARIGSRWYATHGSKLVCFDTSTGTACSGQPYALDLGLDAVGDTVGPGAVGSKLIIGYTTTAGADKLTCFDSSTQADCSGPWPASIGTTHSASFAAPPFPLLSTAGAPTGACIGVSSGARCIDLEGVLTPTPAGMADAMKGNYYGGASVVIGTRVYLGNGDLDGGQGAVQCWDYASSAICPSFPKTFGGTTGYLYTVNPDPNRPACLWVNSDNGSGQIQSFDAYSGDSCGSGTTRVLTTQFIVPQEQCYPTEYRELQLASPARDTYTHATIAFADGAGNPIPGVPAQQVDNDGSVDLSGLDLDSAAGLPQFLITMEGGSETEQLVVKLTWADDYDPACVGEDTVIEAQPTSLTTSLTDGVQDSAKITVPPGTAVEDTSDLKGANASSASGTVEYDWYSDSVCSVMASDGAPRTITTAGTMPVSESVTLAAGTYYPVARYSGDAGNLPSAGTCGDEVLQVGQPAVEDDPEEPAVTEPTPPETPAAPAPTTPVRPAPRTPAPSPSPLACTGRSLVLVDVTRIGDRVRLTGIARPELAGQSVTLRDGASGRSLGSARVHPGGAFQADIEQPTSRRAATARYQAAIGVKRSESLRLTRHIVITRRQVARDGILITGRFAGVRSARTITLTRQTGCATAEKVTSIRTSRRGRFSVTLARPETGRAYYRAGAALGSGETYSLPIAVGAR